MALIIEGIEMPKACWQFRYGEERYVCPLFESCKKKIHYDMDFRPSACPIKGEIPDKHGNLKDEQTILNEVELRFGKVHSLGYVSDIVQDMESVIMAVPTVVESTE